VYIKVDTSVNQVGYECKSR